MSNNLIEYAKSLWKDNDGDSAMQTLIDYLRTKDMVEVVRCKECKYSRGGGHYCEIVVDYRTPDDYCSRGERR